MTSLEKAHLVAFANTVWDAITKIDSPVFERGSEAYITILNARTALRESLSIIDNAVARDEREIVTNCCSTKVIGETDICKQCGEHSELIHTTA